MRKMSRPAKENASSSKDTSASLPRQRDILSVLIEADLVDSMVALASRLFYSTQIPVCLWFGEEKGNAQRNSTFSLN